MAIALPLSACVRLLYWAGPLPAYRRRSHKTESRIIRAFARRGRRRIAWAANAQECGHLATGAGASPEPSGASVTRSMQNSTPALLLALLLAVSPDPAALARSLGTTFWSPRPHFTGLLIARLISPHSIFTVWNWILLPGLVSFLQTVLASF